MQHLAAQLYGYASLSCTIGVRRALLTWSFLLFHFILLRNAGSGATGTLGDLMSKSGIRGNISQFDNDIAAVHAKGLDYIMG